MAEQQKYEWKLPDDVEIASSASDDYMQPDDYDEYEEWESNTCDHCHGTGQDWDLTECPFCDGEGRKWWLP